MFKVIDGRGTGKTSRLMLLAKESGNGDGVIVCRKPKQTQEKAYAYGILGLDFVSYSEYFNSILDNKNIFEGKNIFIDNLSDFLNAWDSRIKGYCDDKENK